MKNIKISQVTICLIFLISFSKFSFSQERTDSVLFRAMKDELERNMKQLVYKDYQKPFYISYTLEDIKTIYASASLGSLSSSANKRYRSWSNRILCGDYQLNDENFIDATRRRPSSDGSLQLPLDDDYFGIRRALWLMTNNTYKSAAENYKSKLAALKDKNLGKDVLQIPDFCQAPTIRKSFENGKTDWDKTKLESYLREISSVFYQFPDIIYSEASAFQLHADLYFYSSEQSKIKSPIDLLFITVSAYCQSADGDNITDQIHYAFRSTQALPATAELKADAMLFAQTLIQKGKAPLLDENYTGPVLFLDQAASEIFLQGLFGGTDNLLAYREPLYNNSQMSMYYGQNMNSLEAKLDKQVVHKGLTIKDLSTTKFRNGVELLGSYNADAEGVLPADTLVLIENGTLKTLYNGRTPTRKIAASNGHRRYTLVGGGISSDLGPGVIEISTTEGKNIDALKQELIKAAKEEGLDYAIIIKPCKSANYEVPFLSYKINVNTGREELVRGASMQSITINSLKKIAGISDKSLIYNTLLGVGRKGGESSGMPDGQESIPGGIPVSIIAPNGVIIKEIEFQHQTKALASDKPIVNSPLLK